MTVADPIHDQVLAAFDEAARAVKAVPSVGVAKTPITSRVLSKWARGGPFQHGLVSRPVAQDEHGRQGGSVDWTCCSHVAATPQLCFGMSHLPGHLLCAACWLTAAADSEDACDWCGVGPTEEVDLYPAIYPIGPALVLLTLCHEHVTTPDPQHWRKHLRNTLTTHS